VSTKHIVISILTHVNELIDSPNEMTKEYKEVKGKVKKFQVIWEMIKWRVYYDVKGEITNVHVH
jgi:hypothetical protein